MCLDSHTNMFAVSTHGVTRNLILIRRIKIEVYYFTEIKTDQISPPRDGRGKYWWLRIQLPRYKAVDLCSRQNTLAQADNEGDEKEL